jgi:hypothetical protein
LATPQHFFPIKTSFRLEPHHDARYIFAMMQGGVVFALFVGYDAARGDVVCITNEG